MKKLLFKRDDDAPPASPTDALAAADAKIAAAQAAAANADEQLHRALMRNSDDDCVEVVTARAAVAAAAEQLRFTVLRRAAALEQIAQADREKADADRAYRAAEVDRLLDQAEALAKKIDASIKHLGDDLDTFMETNAEINRVSRASGRTVSDRADAALGSFRQALRAASKHLHFAVEQAPANYRGALSMISAVDQLRATTTSTKDSK